MKLTLEAIATNMTVGALVVFGSTTYPGTTAELIRPILEKVRLTVEEDILLAYSPERINSVNKEFNTTNTPKVFSGVINKIY